MEVQGSGLIKYVKRSTSRDFKVDLNSLKMAVEKEQEEEEEEEAEEEADEADEAGPDDGGGERLCWGYCALRVALWILLHARVCQARRG